MSLLALVAACTQQLATREDWIGKLPAPRPIAGLAGFQCTSTLNYAADPSRPHVLETTYVFPARVRWHLSVRDDTQASRHVEYRCGDAYFELADGERASTRVEEESAKLEKCAAGELRRALFLWPDGFDWRSVGDARSTTIECGATLTARLGEREQPTEMSLELGVESDRRVVQRYANITWRELRGRWWPASMNLELAGEPVWSETVDSVETAVFLLDEFFVPPDRRSTADGNARSVLRIDHPAAVTRRVALPADCAWTSAHERAAELSHTELAPLIGLGWRADVGTWFELSDSGKPSACWLRLRPGVSPIPEGWALTPEATALCVAVPSLDADLGTALANVRAAIPTGAHGTQPLVRVVGSETKLRVQLVLPLKPAK